MAFIKSESEVMRQHKVAAWNEGVFGTVHHAPVEGSTPRSVLKKSGPTVPRATSGGDRSSLRGDLSSIRAQLRRSGRLWEDPDFPADDSSLFFSQSPARDIEWKRPHELTSRPMFIEDGASRFDVKQGELGDCWFLAAVGSLSLHQELFRRVMPPGQSFEEDDYCGAFTFNFWRFGEWRSVLVDDRLPTSNGRLVYMHSTDRSEFWSALLEKAYAKLVGSYEALRGGSAGEAMEDFTGGVVEYYSLQEEVPDNLFELMLRAARRSSLLSCSIDPDPHVHEARLPTGLVAGHAYSVTDVREVDVDTHTSSRSVRLLRIRNPWGNATEWNGAWSDNSAEWRAVSGRDRNLLGLTACEDGEFWMCYEDFLANFQAVEICHLGPMSLSSDSLDGVAKRRWETCVENGEWRRRVNAGGCRNFPTFGINPQYRVHVVDPDQDDDEDLGTIIVGLMQKNMRIRRKEGAILHQIGYIVYRLNDAAAEEDERLLDMKFFLTNRSVARSPAFINRREVCGRHKLAPGHYVIVPSTFEPDKEAEFLLRIYSERPYHSSELDEETKMVDPRKPSVPESAVRSPEKVHSELYESFLKVSGDDREIDAYELRDILDAVVRKEKFDFDGFNIETCRSMISLMDYDQSGRLGFDEFRVLWDHLRLCKMVFRKYDDDGSGNFNVYELRRALNAVGYRVSNKVFNSLALRFSTRDGVIHFDDFVSCCVRLKTLFETFQCQQKDRDGNAVFDRDQFLQCIVYV